MKKVLLNIFILCLLVTAAAGSGAVRFKHISLDEGLSQNVVFCIHQDSKGFMWFGTQDGLNKYDGYTFTVYKRDPDNLNSLSSSTITAICEGRSGMLWIGTEDGLNRFDPKTERFFRYPVDPRDPACLNDGMIHALYADGGGTLWIGTERGGLSRLTRGADGKETFTHYRHIPTDPGSLSSNHVTSILEDSRGVPWIGTRSGLNRFDKKESRFTRFTRRSGDSRSLSDNRINTIYEDRMGTLWIGTAVGGLNVLNRKTGTFDHYRFKPGDSHSLGSNYISSICEDHSGVLWVGCKIGGLNRLDKRTGTFSRYGYIPDDSHSLSNNEVESVFEDRSGILWIGTHGGGLNKFDREHKFQHFKSEPGRADSLSGNFVFAIHEDRFGFLWIGTNGGGLNKINRRNGTYTHYRRNPKNPRGLNSDGISSICEDRDGVLWIGTFGGGLNKFHRDTETFTHYMSHPTIPGTLSSNRVRTIYRDRAGTMWVGTMGSGFNKYHPETDAFTRYISYPNYPHSLGTFSVRTIYEAPSEPGVLWLGTWLGGLCRFDTRDESFRTFLPEPGDIHSISHKNVQAVMEDGTGTLWVGTLGGGLNKMIRGEGEKTTFIHYTEKDGLCNNAVYGILEDREGRLWLSTNNGLSRFDPGTGRFKNYNVRDGLQGNEFNEGAYFKSESGEMFFGGIKGFNAFYPSRMKTNPHVPPVAITAFYLFNKPVTVGAESPDSPLDTTVTWAKEIRLSYRQNAFSFEFAALDYTVPENNRYAYKMEGLDEDWHDTGPGKRFAYYTNMAPGEYVFRVKGSNNDWVWNTEGASVRIVIAPPFWQTLWFRSLMVLAALGLAVLLYRRRLGIVRLRAELQTARDAQMSIMPREDPRVEGFEISGVCVPASEVGGDFFDYIWLNEERTTLGIAVGDVSGKAMKSAMTAVMTSGMIYSRAGDFISVEEIMKRVNRPLYFKTEKKVFTALCLVALDIPGKRITFTNAGLTEPLLKSGDRVSTLKGVGTRVPLGLREDSIYLEQKQQLESGDVVVFFTDGVTEARNPRGEFYGLGALKRLLEKTDLSSLTARGIMGTIITDADRFTHGAARHDDMTVVVVKVI